MVFWNKIFKKQKEEENKTGEDSGKKARVSEKKENSVSPVKGEAGKKSLYDFAGILKNSHITEKTSNAAKENKYVFSVARKANKVSVKQAVEERYEVRVERVRIINLPPKKRTRGRIIGWKPGLRKAIVALRAGQTIEIQ